MGYGIRVRSLQICWESGFQIRNLFQYQRVRCLQLCLRGFSTNQFELFGKKMKVMCVEISYMRES